MKKYSIIIRDTVEQYNKNFNQVEQDKKFELLPHEWSVEGGELTPTIKTETKSNSWKNIKMLFNGSIIKIKVPGDSGTFFIMLTQKIIHLFFYYLVRPEGLLLCSSF